MVEAVLVTGGTGFIGSHLVEYLLAMGERVRVLVRNPSNLRWLTHLRSSVDVVVGDVGTGEGLREAFRGVKEVYHLAAVFKALGRRRTRVEGELRRHEERC